MFLYLSYYRIIKGTWLSVSLKHCKNVLQGRGRDLEGFLALMLPSLHHIYHHHQRISALHARYYVLSDLVHGFEPERDLFCVAHWKIWCRFCSNQFWADCELYIEHLTVAKAF